MPVAVSHDPKLEARARKLWQEISFSALLYRWDELPEDWRENWRELIRARSVDSTDRQQAGR